MIGHYSVYTNSFGDTIIVGGRIVGRIINKDNRYHYDPPIMPSKLTGSSQSFDTYQECLAYLTGLLRILGVRVELWEIDRIDTIPTVLRAPIDDLLRPEA